MRCVWFYLTIKRNGTPQTRLEHNAFNACFVLAWGGLLSKCSHDHQSLQLASASCPPIRPLSYSTLHPPTHNHSTHRRAMDGGRGSSSNGGASASASAGKKKMKYVCVTGGVVSGLGKGKRREGETRRGPTACILYMPFHSLSSIACIPSCDR